MAILTSQSEVRLRLVLISLLLVRPFFAGIVLDALETLDPQAQVTLRCYYTVAVLPQALCLLGTPDATSYSHKTQQTTPL